MVWHTILQQVSDFGIQQEWAWRYTKHHTSKSQNSYLLPLLFNFVNQQESHTIMITLLYRNHKECLLNIGSQLNLVSTKSNQSLEYPLINLGDM